MTGAMKIYKHYKSYDEIKGDPRFTPDNLIDLTNYKELDGYYGFEDGKDIKCCVRKPNGNACDHLHRSGWVPVLTDGSITVIGGDCAREKFGAESIVGRHIVAAEKAIRKEKVLARWRELIGNRETMLAALASARTSAEQASHQLLEFQDALGGRGCGLLSGMNRNGNSTVQIWGIVDPKWNEDGDIIRDGRGIPNTVGRLAQINVCQDHVVRTLFDDLKKVTQAYQVTENAVAQMSNKDLEALLGALEERARSVEAVKQFAAAAKAFLANDFTMLAFLTHDKSERIRIARFGMEHAGKPTGRDPAKAHIQNWESRLKAEYKVERISIR